jgi:hypothetical protein
VVDYFPHYCQHKKTLFILEERYGNDGYAFWFKLLEMLGNSKGHYLDLNDSSEMEFLMAKTHLSGVIGMEILDLLAKLGAIDPEAWSRKAIWCQNFVDGVAPVYQSRRQPVPQKPSCLAEKPEPSEVISGRNPQADGIPHTDNPQTRVEKTIGEKSRSEEDRSLREGETQAVAAVAAPATDDNTTDIHIDDDTLEEEIRNLPAWGRWTEADRVWLTQTMADNPRASPSDVRDCRDYWLAHARKHTHDQWRTRLRNWLRRLQNDGGTNGNEAGRNKNNGRSARALPTTYEPPPVYTRPLLRE